MTQSSTQKPSPWRRVERRLRRLAWQVRSQSVGTTWTRFGLPDGQQVDYPFRSEVGRQLFMREFEPDEVRFLQSVLKKGDVVLDIGANAGIYSLLASRIVGPAGHVYAFEIGPEEIRLFRHNLQLNGVENVTLLAYAVSDQTGQASFALAQDGAMNSLAQNDHPHQAIQSWLTVDTITLGEAARRHGIDRVDFIKMDVEGAEKLVFEGGLDALRAWKPRYILFEASNLTTSGFGYRVADLIDYLDANGFAVYALDGQELVPVTGQHPIIDHRYNFVAIPR